MGVISKTIYLWIAAILVAGLPLLADDSNGVITNFNAATPVAIIQLQEQLREAQLALETETKNNQDLLLARIQSLEQTIASQHAADLESARKSQQFLLLFCGLLGGAALAILLFMAYFQWRALAQLVEITTHQSASLPLMNGGSSVTAGLGQMAASSRMMVENSNARLLGSVEKLERRIAEMERSARGQFSVVETPMPRPAAKGNGNGHAAPMMEKTMSAKASDRDECVANLVAEGQALLNQNESKKALECFDAALGLHPTNCEALVKKGTALERLGQLDEALGCYDLSIKIGGTTIAYLQKGGLLNRLARYDEALKCYEYALHSQEKNQ
jgi:tetratricopeptide (TPR) repeat protein